MSKSKKKKSPGIDTPRAKIEKKKLKKFCSGRILTTVEKKLNLKVQNQKRLKRRLQNYR